MAKQICIKTESNLSPIVNSNFNEEINQETITLKCYHGNR